MRSRSRCRSPRPRSRASRLHGARTVTRRPGVSRCGTSSRRSATHRSRATTAARPLQVSPPTRSRSCTTSGRTTTRSSTTSPRRSPTTTPTPTRSDADDDARLLRAVLRAVRTQGRSPVLPGQRHRLRRGRGTCRCGADRRGDPAVRRARRTATRPPRSATNCRHAACCASAATRANRRSGTPNAIRTTSASPPRHGR